MNTKKLLEQAILNADLDETARLLTLDPSAIDFKTDGGVPFAFLAAKTGDLALVKYIVEYSRASMNLRDDKYRNILHYAVM